MAKIFKHLTLDDRITILTEIKNNTLLREIARKINKDPTTISKEVKLHRYIKETKRAIVFATKGYFCQHYESCKTTGLCKLNKCYSLCKTCRSINCNKICSHYEPYVCKRLKRFPYVCNGCEKNQGCKRTRYYYDTKIANNEYEISLKESRKGINLEEKSFKYLDNVITDGVKKGKSIYSILLNHPEIKSSERTIYRYIENKYLSITNLDLRNKVKMKPRKNYNTKNKNNDDKKGK